MIYLIYYEVIHILTYHCFAQCNHHIKFNVKMSLPLPQPQSAWPPGPLSLSRLLLLNLGYGPAYVYYV